MSELNNNYYLKFYDKHDNQYLINSKYIRFMVKYNNNDKCFNVCSNMSGCNKDNFLRVCKSEYYDDWEKVNKFFSSK
jgi:hypothetical protein